MNSIEDGNTKAQLQMGTSKQNEHCQVGRETASRFAKNALKQNETR